MICVFRWEKCIISSTIILEMFFLIFGIYFVVTGTPTGLLIAYVLKCWTNNFSIHASGCPAFIMNQLKSVYNIPLLDSYSHPIHTCLSMITSNDNGIKSLRHMPTSCKSAR